MRQEFAEAVKFLERDYDSLQWGATQEDSGYFSDLGLCITRVYSSVDGTAMRHTYTQPMFTLKGDLDQSGPSEEVTNWYYCTTCVAGNGHRCSTCERPVTCDGATEQCIDCWDFMLKLYIKALKREIQREVYMQKLEAERVQHNLRTVGATG